jgi:pilus assembly protein CpaE
MELAESIYVVSQADVPGLRNAQRYVSHMQRFGAERVRLVLNRYDSRRNDIEEEHVTKAVGVPVTWKVPNDYAAVRKSHNTAVPLALGDSLFSRAVRQMARDACGKPAGPAAKKGLRLFG